MRWHPVLHLVAVAADDFTWTGSELHERKTLALHRVEAPWAAQPCLQVSPLIHSPVFHPVAPVPCGPQGPPGAK